jgi:hypothetical protein
MWSAPGLFTEDWKRYADLQDLRSWLLCWWRLKSSGMFHHVIWWIVTNILQAEFLQNVGNNFKGWWCLHLQRSSSLRKLKLQTPWSFEGHAMAQAVSWWPFTAEARVRSWVSPCRICGRQNGIGTGPPPSPRVLWFSPVSLIPPLKHQKPFN